MEVAPSDADGFLESLATMVEDGAVWACDMIKGVSIQRVHEYAICGCSTRSLMEVFSSLGFSYVQVSGSELVHIS